ICFSLFTYSEPRLVDETDRVRSYTRGIEFDYVSWMLNALWIKIQQGATGTPGYISREDGKIAVTDYLQLTGQLNQADDALNRIYADASITDKATASAHLRAQIADLTKKQAAVAPIAEAVLQEQVSEVAADFGLTTLGQPIPSILFHSTPVPDALIISPRDQIEQIVNISLLPDLTLEQQIDLEDRVSKGLNVSALVVPIGGVGVYPTMITQTTDLSWLTTTIAHEWTHNYLDQRPLGLLYDETPELRTMNETTADISGGEIGTEVLRRYYPELVGRASLPDGGRISFDPFGSFAPSSAPPFDFNQEMHTTRVTVDALLAAGKIEEAESYMEQRRQLFVQNGYYIRKLNQAYFAFYGAYADVPGGAAGEDPVGPAVRALRAQSRSLADFINRIAWMTSFDELKKAVGQ
ncbi:MAG TPA: hypothetical protein VLZ89_11850, partial [Anaerolineales bacterium]|nr:hypothetical protein [Anaerolineales bacterium]